MPEGDTIFRTATTLRRWMLGRAITAARSTAPIPVGALVGDTVAGIDARAKHLLIRFESGRVLHTHMLMTGSWHVYWAGERWRKPVSQARLVLEAGQRLAVCFSAPVVELLAPGGEQAHPALAQLGPDVLVESLDMRTVLARAAAQGGETQIGDILLDQSVVSGIGNIYRCETLFLNRVHPASRASTVDLGSLLETAARLMRLSAGRNVAPSRHLPWVYGRSGRPCRRCGTRIASGRLGVQGRTAYWCPRCQAAP